MSTSNECIRPFLSKSDKKPWTKPVLHTIPINAALSSATSYSTDHWGGASQGHSS
jgi:hypothetical protein